MSEKHKAENLTSKDVEQKVVNFIHRVHNDFGYVSMINADHINTMVNGVRTALRHAKLNVPIKLTYKPKIIERITTVDRLMASNMFWYNVKECETLEKALCEAVWNPDEPDQRLDDGTSDIDTLDAFEYSISGHIFQFSNKAA